MTDMDQIDKQNLEFDALHRLAKAFQRCNDTPVVDDDYPEMRHYYESALREFVRALKVNRGAKFFTTLGV